MARVFLSHSSRDNVAAAELKAWLDGQGFAPAFLDFDKHSGIPPGADWERTLYDQIQRCQALLILQTPNWSASRWCFAEFTQARALGKPIFQLVQTDEAAAEKPIAADLQRLDLRHDRPAGLEQLRRELERIALQDQGGFPWPPPSDSSRAPFPGLMVFEEEDAPVFFGRDNDWRVVIERLNTRRVQGGPRLLVIQGSSGSGKSSLLRAGVLPRLRRAGRQWLVLPVLRPQARPLESQAQTLALALQRPETWQKLHQQLLTTTAAPALAGLVAGWAADLRLAASAPEAQLLLPIDQAEELFTVAEAAERERFVAGLAAMLQPAQRLQAVMTIRADAMGSLQSLPELVDSLDTLPLGPLSLERYREIIEGPARVAGLKVEPAFVERAINDTGTEDALPLLAFALRQLHERFGADGVLSLSDYQSLGDPAAGLSPLENAVKQAADGVLQALRPDEASLNALREAFVPAMVRVGEQGVYARRAAAWDSLPQAARPFLEALVAARLLVRRQGEGQPSTVEVAHEALLRVWPLLRGWLDESRDFLLGSQQLEQDLAQWQAASPADRPRALLSGLKLARARAWLAERSEQLRPELRAFIQTSQKHAVRQRRILQGSAAGAFALISCAGGLAFLQLQRARAAQAAQFEATHQAVVTSDPFLSVVYGLAAAKPLLDGNKPWEAAQLSQSLQEAVMANMARSAPIATGQEAVWSLI
ncbi:toll/interleukin-1 receptor domain-containing protein, partial [Cyanobium sp. FGCU-6]|nr:toll/interleukin-1 receptor domain-containing protein [Cyanobium sp. FGCU6]